jgi:hypothetical protein
MLFLMKVPAASCGVSSGITASQPVFALTRFAVVRLTIHPCNKLQGIPAKPNKGKS